MHGADFTEVFIKAVATFRKALCTYIPPDVTISEKTIRTAAFGRL